MLRLVSDEDVHDEFDGRLRMGQGTILLAGGLFDRVSGGWLGRNGTHCNSPLRTRRRSPIVLPRPAHVGRAISGDKCTPLRY